MGSDKELEQIIAYSRAQIDVSQSFELSLYIATYQKGPQAVENPSQNLSAAAVFVPLKSVNQLANSISQFIPFSVLIALSQIPKQQVAEPLTPRGALVYLVPLENKKDNPNMKLSITLKGHKNFSSKIQTGVTSAAKWVASVLYKVMGAISDPQGAINPTAGMIAKGVGAAAGMANKFLNR
ncbi:MAG: hypothetical protein EZS28_003113 [Streblomastix strix]|uniref:Uncharacterized protein n=1 Tax=Streblomastix strix TaxID=222440 RepID=A0A5J4X2F2_9EUKA|nr:MAG: hypothetical protein EZS28_003113 [Streblomastix strix]